MSIKPTPDKSHRFPNLGRLSVAILEHVNASFLGEKAVEELKAPLIQKELQDSLEKALGNAEKRFRQDYKDIEICELLINLPLADLPSVRQALQAFYIQPVDSTLPQILREQLKTDLPRLPIKRIDAAVLAYIRILRQELIPISDDIRGKLNTLATLDTEVHTARIAQLITQLIDVLTAEHESSDKKLQELNRSSSMATATNQGAQAGDINVNVSLPNHMMVDNLVGISDEYKKDDSKPTTIGWDARDPVLLKRYYQLGRQHYPRLFKKELVDLDETKVRDHLTANGLAYLAPDGHLYLTDAGVLLCCKQDRFPLSVFHTHVKFKDTSGVEDLTVELFGSVFYLYNELFRLLKPMFQRRLGSPNIRDDVGSESVFFEYPKKAIVETLVNFLIHRDYFEEDIGFITVYPDRIEFVNPGQSKYSPSVLLETEIPLRPKYDRNQRLIEAINRAGLNQREGGGILAIKQELKKNQSYRPDGSLGLSIENDPLNDRFVLTIYKRTPRVIIGATEYPPVSPNTPKSGPGTVPPLPSLIVGRDNDLNNLKDNLGITGKPIASIQILTAIKGWPGVGKTTVASALAHDGDIQRTFPDGVLWVSLGQQPDLLSELAAWGRALDSDELSRAKTLEESQALLAALLRNRRMLLIIDDVWQPEHAMPFKVGGANCAVLITTRRDDVANALAPTAKNIYRLKVLADEDALTLLKELAPVVAERYPEECLILVRELEGLPLALQVAGRLLNTEFNRGFGVVELISDLRRGARLLEAEAPADRVELANETTPTIAALLQKSLDLLDDKTRDSYAYLGVFAPKPATFDMEAMKFVWQVEDPKPIITTLVDRGLLEFVPELDRYQMHAILVMLAKSLLTDDEEVVPSVTDSGYLHHAKYYETIFRQANELYIQGGDALKRGLALFDKEWENISTGLTWTINHLNDADVAELYLSFIDDGSYLFDLRLPPHELMRLMEAALNVSQLLGKREAELRYLNMLGIAYRNIGNPRKAIDYCTQALIIAREVNDHHTEGNILGNLGLAYAVIGEVQRSIELYEQALVIERKVGDRRGEGLELINLGISYIYLKEPHRALESYNKALKLYRQIGDFHGEANALDNLAVANKDLGDFHQAIELHEQALKIFREIGDRRGESNALGNLGVSYHALGKYSVAIELYQQALLILREIDDYLGEARVLNNLSITLGLTGNLSEAINYAEQALKLYENSETPETLNVLKQLDEWRKQV